ncbi:unnamed protein product [Protopolystoma xenopodis]|uniref:Uncharacterized protein n=1 Tax=Protopolystoma xenopodis TaxID=117903 RepID=A0A3S5APK7_9PLAT|nr:unnamed protein product [Protopolystoma xenopodis]
MRLSGSFTDESISFEFEPSGQIVPSIEPHRGQYKLQTDHHESLQHQQLQRRRKSMLPVKVNNHRPILGFTESGFESHKNAAYDIKDRNPAQPSIFSSLSLDSEADSNSIAGTRTLESVHAGPHSTLRYYPSVTPGCVDQGSYSLLYSPEHHPEHLHYSLPKRISEHSPSTCRHIISTPNPLTSSMGLLSAHTHLGQSGTLSRLSIIGEKTPLVAITCSDRTDLKYSSPMPSRIEQPMAHPKVSFFIFVLNMFENC